MSAEDLRANPYVGLRPFFEEDSLYFYGREQQTAELLEILRQHRFLGVVGSSGSGKSSLVRAGLLPGLLGGFLVHDRDRWRTLQMKPGDAPIVNLCVGLLKATGQGATRETVGALEQEVRDGHTGAVIDFLMARLDANANLFLLVDQFEEVFAFRGLEDDESQLGLDPARRRERARRRAEAADFVDLLLALAEQRDLPIYVALTMRTDFLGDCDLFHGLPEALNRGRYLVPRMKREQLRDAVECPAMLMDAHISPRLMDHVLNELGDRFDRLPVLQHALLRTWDAWQDVGGMGPIDLRHFQTAGGLEGALDQDAEAALKGLDIDTVSRVFKRLTDTDLSQRRVRSPARISELVFASGAERAAVEAIVQRFEGDGRSFVHRSADGKPDDPRVDISHESLIRQWDRLHRWVDEERRARDDYIDLVRKSRKRERNEAALLLDPELQMTLDWRAGVKPTPGWARRYSVAEGDFACAMGYLDQSLDARSRGEAELELRLRWKKIWSPLLLAVQGALGLWLASKYSSSDKLGLLGASGQLFEAVLAAELGLGMLTTGLDKLGDLLFSWNLVRFVLFLAACAWLNFHAKRWHEKFALPRILAAGGSIGRRDAVPAEELPDAANARHIAYASTLQRVNGFWRDALAQIFVAGLLFFGCAAMFGFVHGMRGLEGDYEASDGEMVVIFVLIATVNFLMATQPLVSEEQATKGMQRAGIYRTDLYGRRLSWARATAWYLLRIPSMLFYLLGFAMQPFTPKRQTLQDWAAGTVVLQRPAVESTSAESTPDKTAAPAV